MDDSYVLDQFQIINTKLDKLTELTQQTQLQEYRLTKVEEYINNKQKDGRDTMWRVITPVFSAIISAVLSFIIAGGLQK